MKSIKEKDTKKNNRNKIVRAVQRLALKERTDNIYLNFQIYQDVYEAFLMGIEFSNSLRE